eukprot:SAG31_NODE_4017_length_3662_cov_2.917485_1_plen_103_part_00
MHLDERPARQPPEDLRGGSRLLLCLALPLGFVCYFVLRPCVSIELVSLAVAPRSVGWVSLTQALNERREVDSKSNYRGIKALYAARAAETVEERDALLETAR